LKSFKGGGKFIDRLRFTVKGGAGGMGHPKYGKDEALLALQVEFKCVWLFNKFIVFHKGGIGGKGGDVILVAKEGLTIILQKYATNFHVTIVTSLF